MLNLGGAPMYLYLGPFHEKICLRATLKPAYSATVTSKNLEKFDVVSAYLLSRH